MVLELQDMDRSLWDCAFGCHCGGEIRALDGSALTSFAVIWYASREDVWYMGLQNAALFCVSPGVVWMSGSGGRLCFPVST